jgi:CRP-like cAMP-binding protein
MRDETMDEFLGLMTEVNFKRNKPVIDYNQFDDNIYVIKKGILRIAYWDGFNEMTRAFAAEGSVLISYYSFYKREASFFKLEACCDSVLMKVSKTQFLDLVSRSHDFATWVMWMQMWQLWLYEKKMAIINGDAKERFEALILARPEIMENVSSRNIASYIGVTPIYLSKLKRAFSHLLKK